MARRRTPSTPFESWKLSNHFFHLILIILVTLQSSSAKFVSFHSSNDLHNDKNSLNCKQPQNYNDLSIDSINNIFPMWSKGFSRVCCDIYPDRIQSNGKDFFEHALPIGYYNPNYGKISRRHLGLIDSIHSNISEEYYSASYDEAATDGMKTSSNSLDERYRKQRTLADSQHDYSSRKIQNGDIIYVPSADLPDFILGTFMNIPKDIQIILVSGCEDIGVPFELFYPNRSKCADFQTSKMWPTGYHNISMTSFVSDKRLFRWYTQNFDGIGCNCYSCSLLTPDEKAIIEQKIVAIPIGLDLHGQLGADDEIPSYKLDSFAQFRDLSSLRLLSIPFYQRINNAVIYAFDCNIGECRIDARGKICNILRNTDFNNRNLSIVTGAKIDSNIQSLEIKDKTIHVSNAMLDCYLSVDQSHSISNLVQHAKNIVHELRFPARINRVHRRWHYWFTATMAPFTIAPSGGGLDTHRLWEALQMGSVPITLSSTLDRLYRDYPIIILNNWNELLEPDILSVFRKDIISRFGENPFNATMMNKLSIWYWKQLIEGDKKRLLQHPA